MGVDVCKLKLIVVGKGIGNWLEDMGIEVNNLIGFMVLFVNMVDGGNGSIGV